MELGPFLGESSLLLKKVAFFPIEQSYPKGGV
jgi:hypothetical protein